MTRKVRLAELQLAIMSVLWDQGEATVAQVRESLEAANRPLAHTTIATMISRMETEGHLEHRSQGRANIYRPLLHRDAVSRDMVSDLAGRLFGGDVTQMVAHLLADSDVTQDEIQRLKKLVRDKEKEVKDGQ
jgi:BlaI family transcriptional regulator, penicillinase repressor